MIYWHRILKYKYLQKRAHKVRKNRTIKVIICIFTTLLNLPYYWGIACLHFQCLGMFITHNNIFEKFMSWNINVLWPILAFLQYFLLHVLSLRFSRRKHILWFTDVCYAFFQISNTIEFLARLMRPLNYQGTFLKPVKKFKNKMTNFSYIEYMLWMSKL